ncbi:hypothetical protein C3Z06_16990 [Cupriavidus metallidurans]|nr:hypothetical protein C3Z06_16990 [Cupriavidus metallidurans]
MRPSDGRWIAYGYTRRQALDCFSLFGCSRLRSSALAVAGICRPCGTSGARSSRFEMECYGKVATMSSWT